MRLFAAVVACLAAAPLRAELGFEVAPIRAVVVHVHGEIADRAFLAPLRARLARDLAPPLHEPDTTFDLSRTPSFLGRLDAEALMQALLANIPAETNVGVVHVLLIARHMRGGAARFNFAWSFGGHAASHRAIIVSLARLTDPDPDLVAARVAKMIVKNVARVAGYSGSDRCVLSFAATLADLDATPESYCEPDLGALVAGGVARR